MNQGERDDTTRRLSLCFVRIAALEAELEKTNDALAISGLRLLKAETERDSLQCRLFKAITERDAAVEALKPFATAAMFIRAEERHDESPNDDVINNLDNADLRRARSIAPNAGGET